MLDRAVRAQPTDSTLPIVSGNYHLHCFIVKVYFLFITSILLSQCCARIYHLWGDGGVTDVETRSICIISQPRQSMQGAW